MDIVFNGTDYFTVQQNIEIDRLDILEGIHNLVEMISKRYRVNSDWSVKPGMRPTAQSIKKIEKLDSNSEEDEG